MHSDNSKVQKFTLSKGDIVIWVDEGASLHIKCTTSYGDPVEMSSEEVIELCGLLQTLIKRIE